MRPSDTTFATFSTCNDFRATFARLSSRLSRDFRDFWSKCASKCNVRVTLLVRTNSLMPSFTHDCGLIREYDVSEKSDASVVAPDLVCALLLFDCCLLCVISIIYIVLLCIRSSQRHHQHRNNYYHHPFQQHAYSISTAIL